jgi:hypothetical protein
MDGLMISDIDAELARRGMPAPDAQQSASPHPSGLTLDDIDGELNRRGINPTAVPAPAHAAGASGPMANLGAGINEGIANTVGAPVDAMTWALNQGAHGINALAGTALPDIANPVGGSESLKSLMGVAGADPRQVQGGDDFERVMRGGGQGIGSMMMPYGAGRALIANGANGVLGAVGRAFGGAAPAEAGVGTLAAGAAGNAAIGGVGGALGAEGQALMPPDSPYAPLVDLAGNLVGGGATAATMGLAKAGINYGVDQARNLIQPMRRAGQEEIVGDRLRNAATDPAALVAQTQPADLVAGSAPTLYQLTGDSGIGQLERQQRTENPQPFLDRAADQNASRVDALTGLAPEQANPNAVRDLFQQHLSALDQSGDAAVVNARTTAQQAFNAAGGQAPREDYGAAMRDQLEAAKAGAKAQERQLWSAIDPDGSLKINGAPVTDAAKQIIADIPETARPMEGEEAKVFQAAQFLGTASPFNNLSALRSRLLDAIRNERQNGQTPALRRMQMLRSSIDDTMSGAVDNVAQDQAKAVAAGTMNPDMTAQAQIARQAQGWYAGNNVAAPAAINRLAGGDFPGAGNGSIGNALGGSSGVSSIPGDRGPPSRGFELSPGNSGVQGEAQPVASRP